VSEPKSPDPLDVLQSPRAESLIPKVPGRGPDRSLVWVVVPAYNEAPRIGRNLDALCSGWPNVVVVDDGSTDGTSDVARDRRVWLVRHPVNLGQGAALLTGIRFALLRGAEFIITFDADGQHDIGDFEKLLAPLASGEAEIAFGSRFLGETRGIPAGRRLMLGAAVWVTTA
jgi:glycosyltransferase involved in cell wall biosynthesis